MYEYELINNHYVVRIDGLKYLIDTGSPNSFWVSRVMRKVTIDDKDYHLYEKPHNVDVEETHKTVGLYVDGFIGMDILSKTSLTIYKKGVLEFKPLEVSGDEVKMTTLWPLMVKIKTDDMCEGTMVIDTGAKYAYGVSELFVNKVPYEHVTDYNPSMGKLDSDIYHLDVVVGGKKRNIDVCYHNKVAQMLRSMNVTIIGNITSLYDEVCVLNMKKGKLILK